MTAPVLSVYNPQTLEESLMDVSRRRFLKGSAAGLGLSALGFDLKPAYAASRQLKFQNAREYRTVCPYCSVGCGTLAYVHGSGGLNTVKTIVHVKETPTARSTAARCAPKGPPRCRWR